MEKVTGKPAPDIRFFNMDIFKIAGHDVRALRHGMVGQPGWELFGPWEHGEAVRDAIVEAGQEFGIRQVGARTYPTSCLESGWIPSPLPAVYVGDEMKAYRQWLSGKSYEAMASLGGSFYSDDITDYYLTPYDLGYGPFVKFDHDFVGRAALEKMADNQKRKKVTLVWNGEDIEQCLRFVVPRRRRYRQVYRSAFGELFDAAVRQSVEGRQDRRGIDVHRLHLQRTRDDLAGDGRCRTQRAGHRGHARLGRRRTRIVEADGRASRASRNPGDGCARAYRRGCARRLSAQACRRRKISRYLKGYTWNSG